MHECDCIGLAGENVEMEMWKCELWQLLGVSSSQKGRGYIAGTKTQKKNKNNKAQNHSKCLTAKAMEIPKTNQHEKRVASTTAPFHHSTTPDVCVSPFSEPLE